MTTNADSTVAPIGLTTPVLDWRHVHERCRVVARRAAALDREIGRALLDAERARVWFYLGYGGIIEYGKRLLGFAPRLTLERLRVLDVHHVHARADGGSHERANQTSLCGAHHDAIHRGALRVDGDAGGTLVFRHADGTVYGSAPVAAAQQQLADAFMGLKSMGWKEREARQAIDAVRPHVGPDEPLEAVLRRCLAVMRIPTRPAPDAPAPRPA